MAEREGEVFETGEGEHRVSGEVVKDGDEGVDVCAASRVLNTLLTKVGKDRSDHVDRTEVCQP